MDRFASFIGADVHPVKNGALEYKGELHVMNDHHAESFSVSDMWLLVHMLRDCDEQNMSHDNRAVYMTKLVSMYKRHGCKFGEEIDNEICRILEKEKDLFKKCSSRHAT